MNNNNLLNTFGKKFSITIQNSLILKKLNNNNLKKSIIIHIIKTIICCRIYNKDIIRKNTIPNTFIETEYAPMRIHEYIRHIKDDEFHGGDFEISVTYDLFNINIAEYKEYYYNIFLNIYNV